MHPMHPKLGHVTITCMCMCMHVCVHVFVCVRMYVCVYLCIVYVGSCLAIKFIIIMPISVYRRGVGDHRVG